MRLKILATVLLLLVFFSVIWADEPILAQFEKAGIWNVDRPNHRCLIDPAIWARLPFEKKEQILQVIYVEEKTWWKLYDMYSGKLLGEVSSWGLKIHP
jgi:hypothetical protein